MRGTGALERTRGSPPFDSEESVGGLRPPRGTRGGRVVSGARHRVGTFCAVCVHARRLVMKRRRPSKSRAPASRRGPRGPRARKDSHVDATAADAMEIDALREQLQRLTHESGPPRWNANPDDVKRSVVKLVLTLVELIRQLLERQAIRRMENATLTPEETENIGTALMRLEETIRDIGAQFDLSPEDLNLDLGPIGRLL